ncbi:MAG: bifunctional metallophosphatase/5'-nucleotidase [Nevskia sp.]|nr:bifunctional metallophosphatase/5'-nucleotidase [Nevskia sp.]
MPNQHATAGALPSLITLAGVLVLAACQLPATAPDAGAGPASVAIKLIALNDFHGNLLPPRDPALLPDRPGQPDIPVPLGGASYISTAVGQLKAANPRNVVVAAGDLISASPLQSALFHDEPAIAAMNGIGLEFSAVGNHEFDRGRVALLRMQRGGCAPDGKPGVDTCVNGPFPGAAFRYMAANVVDEAGVALLPAVGIKTFIVDGRMPLSIGFIGLTLEGTPELVNRNGIAGLRFLDETETINRQAAALTAQGVRAIVVLIHEGGEPAQGAGLDDESCPGFAGPITGIVARLDPAIDLVISGHTHRVYRCRLPTADPARTLLVTSAGSAGRFLTDIDLQLAADTGEVLSTAARNVPIVNDSAANARPDRYPPLAPEPQVAAIVAEFDRRSRERSLQPVGRIASALSRQQDAAGEMPLGYLIADAQLAAAAKQDDRRADFALMNPGGVRADLAPLDAAGTVSYGQVYTVQPFGGALLTMTLTGAQIDALLEQQWRADGRYAILLPSQGFEYAWKASAPLGARIDPVSIRLRGKPLSPTGRYRVNVNAFLANGGDGFRVLLEGTERVEFGIDREVLIDYLTAQPVSPPKLGRIRRLD